MTQPIPSSGLSRRGFLGRLPCRATVSTSLALSDSQKLIALADPDVLARQGGDVERLLWTLDQRTIFRPEAKIAVKITRRRPTPRWRRCAAILAGAATAPVGKLHLRDSCVSTSR